MKLELIKSFAIVAGFWFLVALGMWTLASPDTNLLALKRLDTLMPFLGLNPPERLSILDAWKVQLQVLFYWVIPMVAVAAVSTLGGYLFISRVALRRFRERLAREKAPEPYRGVHLTMGEMPVLVGSAANVLGDLEASGIFECFTSQAELNLMRKLLEIIDAHPQAYGGSTGDTLWDSVIWKLEAASKVPHYTSLVMLTVCAWEAGKIRAYPERSRVQEPAKWVKHPDKMAAQVMSATEEWAALPLDIRETLVLTTSFFSQVKLMPSYIDLPAVSKQSKQIVYLCQSLYKALDQLAAERAIARATSEINAELGDSAKGIASATSVLPEVEELTVVTPETNPELEKHLANWADKHVPAEENVVVPVESVAPVKSDKAEEFKQATIVTAATVTKPVVPAADKPKPKPAAPVAPVAPKVATPSAVADPFAGLVLADLSDLDEMIEQQEKGASGSVIADGSLEDVVFAHFMKALPSLAFQSKGLPKGVNAVAWKVDNRVYLTEIKLRETIMAKLPADLRASLTPKDKPKVQPFTQALLKAFEVRGWLVTTINNVSINAEEGLWNIKAGQLDFKGIIVIDVPEANMGQLPDGNSMYKVEVLGPWKTSAVKNKDPGMSVSRTSLAGLLTPKTNNGEAKPAGKAEDPPKAD